MQIKRWLSWGAPYMLLWFPDGLLSGHREVTPPPHLSSLQFLQLKNCQGAFLPPQPRAFRSSETVHFGATFWVFLVKWWYGEPQGVLLSTWLLALGLRDFVTQQWGQCVCGGREEGAKCPCLIFLVLIKRLLEKLPDKRDSLTPSGKAGQAFHFMLR